MKLAISQHKLNVSEYLLFKRGEAKTQHHVSEDIGLDSLKVRANQVPQYIETVNKQLYDAEWPTFPEDAKVLVTGIGTS